MNGTEKTQCVPAPSNLANEAIAKFAKSYPGSDACWRGHLHATSL
jgi:hypothetical protein